MNMVTRQPSEAREVPVDVTHAPTATLEVAYQPAGPETEVRLSAHTNSLDGDLLDLFLLLC